MTTSDKKQKPEMKILYPSGLCDKCGKEYGRTNLEYKGVEIWQGCDCHPKDKVYLINRDAIKFLDEAEHE